MSQNEKDVLAYELAMEYFKANPQRFQRDESQIKSIVNEYADIYKKFHQAVNKTIF